MTSFSIFISTLGRPSLERMMESIVTQPLEPGDELLVVGREEGDLRKRVEAYGGRYFWFPDVAPLCYGHPQQNFVISHCRGDYLNYQDDDDVMAPGILKVMRRNCERHPGKIFIYQMRQPDGSFNPGWPPDRLAGGQCFVWPNIPSQMGRFGNGYTGDQDFMESTIALHPEGKDGVIYCPEIITEYAGSHEVRI